MKRIYQSLASQVAVSIRDEIAQNRWTESLPGERQLAAKLNVSRRTVRNALSILRKENAIRIQGGRPCTVAKPGKPAVCATIDRVALLLPEPLENARPFTLLWVNRLMTLLHDTGLQFEVVSGRKYYGQTSNRSLTRLIELHPARCWILAKSHLPLQRWFSSRNIAAVIAGSAHETIDLPNVDTDHRGLCRHAAACLVRNGHRRMALFLEQSHHPGDDESELGFREVIARSVGIEAPTVCRPHSDPTAVIAELDRLLSTREPPTAYLLSNAFSYLTVLGHLSWKGIKVPTHVSLISRDDEPFLRHLQSPIPTRYTISPQKFASALHAAIVKTIEHRVAPNFTVRITPTFISGGSISHVP